MQSNQAVSAVVETDPVPGSVEVILTEANGSHRRAFIDPKSLKYDVTMPGRGLLPFYDGDMLLMTGSCGPGFKCVPVLDHLYRMPVVWFVYDA